MSAPSGAPLAPPASARPIRPASTRPILRLEDVAFAYDGVPVFAGVNLDASSGECVGIEGSNGSGKSTLLLLAGGALKPSRGRVVRDALEHGVLYLPQSPERLFFAETVMEEVAFGLEKRGVSRAAAHEKTRAALAHASLDPEQFAARSPFDLSTGEMRRVAFAIAFALEPEILLLDEPASCLDLPGSAVLDDLVDHSRQRGAAVLVASHALSAPGCDRRFTLQAGRGLDPSTARG